jgi:hypothetical protein
MRRSLAGYVFCGPIGPRSSTFVANKSGEKVETGYTFPQQPVGTPHNERWVPHNKVSIKKSSLFSLIATVISSFIGRP